MTGLILSHLMDLSLIHISGLRFAYVVTENPQMFELYQDSLAKCDLNYGINIMGIAATVAAYTACGTWTEQLMSLISENHRMVSEYCAAQDVYKRQVLYDWQGKCRCLPGSCLGAAQKILAIQYIWDCLLLDRGWFGISFLIQGF